jgi:hypothetical protein
MMRALRSGLSMPSDFLKLLRPWNVPCPNVSGVAAAVSSIAHGNSPPGSVSRVLDGNALVDPAFVVVEVLAGLVETGLLSLEYRVQLVQIIVRLPVVSEQLKDAVFMVLSANMVQTPAARKPVEALFKWERPLRYCPSRLVQQQESSRTLPIVWKRPLAELLS